MLLLYRYRCNFQTSFGVTILNAWLLDLSGFIIERAVKWIGSREIRNSLLLIKRVTNNIAKHVPALDATGVNSVQFSHLCCDPHQSKHVATHEVMTRNWCTKLWEALSICCEQCDYSEKMIASAKWPGIKARSVKERVFDALITPLSVVVIMFKLVLSTRELKPVHLTQTCPVTQTYPVNRNLSSYFKHAQLTQTCPVNTTLSS